MLISEPIPADFPWLSLSILFPIVGSLIVPFIPDKGEGKEVRWYALIIALITFLITVAAYFKGFDPSLEGLQLYEKVSWLPDLGLTWSVGADGLSMPLILLTSFITSLAVLAAWPVSYKPKLFFFLILAMDGGQIAVFAVQDMLLFFLAWELELFPVYLFLAIWGGKKRQYAATKFIIYTAGSSLFILLAGLAMGFFQGGGVPDFGYTHLAQQNFGRGFQLLCYSGLLIAFGVKLPIVPLHTWLPDAHGEANAPVSMLLAGILLKMGGYALLRFNVQILPEVHLQIAPALIILGIINIIYGALNAFAQDNVKRRIACSSVSHMGFVLLGIGAVDALGISGAMLQMISHGLIAAAMFFVTGSFYERTNTLSIPNMGGLAKVLPITFAFFLASSLASLALPGMSGFISEITIFLGITSQDGYSSIFRSITILIAAIGLVLTPIYLLSMCRRVFFGPRIPALATVKEMNSRELTIGFSLLLPTLIIGFWPKVAINLYESSTNALSDQLTLVKLVGLISNVS